MTHLPSDSASNVNGHEPQETPHTASDAESDGEAEFALRLYLEGQKLAGRSDFRNAARLFERSMEIDGGLGDAFGLAATAVELADAYRATGRLDDARSLCEGVVVWLRSLGVDGHTLAKAFHEIVSIELARAGFAPLPGTKAGELLALCFESLAIEQRGGCLWFVRTTQRIGGILSAAGRTKAAEEWYRTALEMIDTVLASPNPWPACRVPDMELAEMNESASRIGFAGIVRIRLTPCPQDGTPEGIRDSMESLRGEIWYDRARDAVLEEDWSRARRCAIEAQGSRALPPYLMAQCKLLLGIALRNEHDQEQREAALAQSLAQLDQALELFRAQGDERHQAVAHYEIANTAMAQGRGQFAIINYLAAATTAAHRGVRALAEGAYRALGQALDSYGESTAKAWADLGVAAVTRDPSERRETLIVASKLFRDAGDLGGLAAAEHLLSQVERAAGDIGLALAHAVVAMKHIQRLRAQEGSQWLRIVPAVPAEVLFRHVLELLGNREAGSLGGFEALEAIEAMRGYRMAGLLHRRVTPDLMEEAAETALRVNVYRDALASRGAPSFARRDPEGQHLALTEGTGWLEAALAQAVQDHQGLVGRLAALSAPEPVVIDELVVQLEQLDADVLLYDLDTSNPDAAVLSVVWWDSERQWPELYRLDVTGDARDLLMQFRSAQSSLVAGGMWTPWIMERLCELLVPERLRDRLEQRAMGGAPPVALLLVLPGSLWRVPFAALHLSGRPLLDFATVTVTPSLRAMTRDDDDAEWNGSLALLGGEVFDEALLGRLFSPLAVVTDRLGLLDELAASRARALAVIDAPHGHETDGLAHGLHLGEGEHLTAADLIGMHLPAGLVFGPCWTAGVPNSDDEEPIGMATVALSQGARWVLASLWPIYAEAARDLYRDFIEGLGELGPQEALRRAQLAACRRSPDRLCDWAAHVIIGTPVGFEPENRPTGVSGL